MIYDYSFINDIIYSYIADIVIIRNRGYPFIDKLNKPYTIETLELNPNKQLSIKTFNFTTAYEHILKKFIYIYGYIIYNKPFHETSKEELNSLYLIFSFILDPCNFDDQYITGSLPFPSERYNYICTDISKNNSEYYYKDNKAEHMDIASILY